MATFLGQSVQFAEWIFARSAKAAPGTISTVKLRRAGFDATLYSDEMFRKWFGRYQTSRLLPTP